jgi:hypothetical protein
MNWKTHNEKLNALYKGNRRGAWAVVIGLLIIGAVIIGKPSPAVDVDALNDCIDGLFNGEYTDTACETCEKLINRK